MAGEQNQVPDRKQLKSQPFMDEAPEMWRGPSLLVRSDVGQLCATGYFVRQLSWEGRIPQSRLRRDPASLASCLGNQLSSAIEDAESWTVAPSAQLESDALVPLYVEIICQDSEDLEQVGGVGSTLFGARAWASLEALPKPGETSPTRNRPVVSDLPDQSSGGEPGLQVVDLRLSTAPNTHGVGTLQFATRFVRLVASESRLLVWWFPPDGQSWSPDAIRWPHSAVPLHSEEGLGAIAQAATVREIVAVLIGEYLGHIRYYQERWPDELDWWERDLFESVTEGTGPLSGLELEASTLVRLQRLSEFLNQSRLDVRLFKRRLDSDPMLRVLPDGEQFQEETKLLLELQSDNEDRRREAFGLLAALASGQQILNANEQRRASEAQRQATERLQSIVVWVSALLLAPSLVIGAFGANLSVLAEGTYGSVGQLAAWALIAAGASSVLLLAVQRPSSKKVRGSWLILAAGVSAGSFAWAALAWPEWVPLVVAGTWLCVFALGLWMRRLHGSRPI